MSGELTQGLSGQEGMKKGIRKSDEERFLLEQLKERESAYEDAVLKVSRYYSKIDRPMTALGYIKRLSESTAEPEKKAFCYLSMGQLMEQNEDFDGAMSYYGQALALEPVNSVSWYFIHNNIACCLNHFARYDEAEQYCRDAIRIDGKRYNAYVNLGVALEGQGEYVEAAQNYLLAVKVNSGDEDVLEHLKELVEEHREIISAIDNIEDQIRQLDPGAKTGRRAEEGEEE